MFDYKEYVPPVGQVVEKSKVLSPRLKAFTEYIIYEGYSNRKAAIAVGVPEANASVYGNRWAKFPCVQVYQKELRDSVVKNGTDYFLRAINTLDTLHLHKKSGDGIKLAAAGKVADIYKKSVLENMVDDAVSQIVDSLVSKLMNPVAGVSEADVDAFDPDEDIEIDYDEE